MNAYIAFLVLAAASAASICTADRLNVEPIDPTPQGSYEVLFRSDLLQQQPEYFVPPSDPQAVALEFARSQLNIKDSDYSIKSSYTTETTGITHMYLKQIIHGIEVSNGDISVHVDRNGKVIAYGDNFYRNPDLSKRSLWFGQASGQFVKPSIAFGTLAAYIGKPIDTTKIKEAPRNNIVNSGNEYVLSGIDYALDEVIAKQAYIQNSRGSLEAAWEFFIDLGDNYFHAHVSADGKRVISLIDWVSSAVYNVLKVGD
jgi:extracellular elastinolytic metalloproteinase